MFIGWLLLGALIAASLEIHKGVLDPLLRSVPSLEWAFKRLDKLDKKKRMTRDEQKEFLRLKDRTSVWTKDLFYMWLFCFAVLSLASSTWGWFVQPLLIVSNAAALTAFLLWSMLVVIVPTIIVMLMTAEKHTFIYSVFASIITTGFLAMGFIIWKMFPPMSVKSFSAFMLVVLFCSAFVYSYRWLRGWKK